QIARTVPDNIGMLFRGSLVMFGPREVLLTSSNPVITQFVNGRKVGPIGMSEEKDEATLAEERASINGQGEGARDENQQPALVPQLVPSPGRPPRQAVDRRTSRVLNLLHTLPHSAQQAITASLHHSSAEPRQPQPPGPFHQAEPFKQAEPFRQAEPAPRPESEDRDEVTDAGIETEEQQSSWPRWLPGGGRR
ncbi:MAG TPA: hypothetical protein VF979_10730, partial [Streptosporangiaceae bacterium]